MHEKHPLLQVSKHERKRLIARAIVLHFKLTEEKNVSHDDVLKLVTDKEENSWLNQDPHSSVWVLCSVSLPKEPCIYEDDYCSSTEVTRNCNEG